ncbi:MULTISPECIES: methylmalonyl Co-A mutase-associated GTPase MeaB [Pseudothermotoga]|uniref:LAO/AO transport system ATPase n=1 Tax=Pseudothermotoga lettingae (strain ATCC BAA-301 / DSM 14385 / NBRC 107922 / TMO) TaxID=416591 RepID=A8F539_PSELT|nr:MULTISPECIES: methylmalonyl Co-A mutase-associated GTPase MeaB [Pseudothermotoga]ABV33273.1 LAO/AO transport system ATPase [Pseudothermotoga lettingae TMO]KUK21910.1 MAG: LAO/AO transport system ATPase [Pseudothermotoga lettingae]MDI3493919.1 GTPase [Pseudothermotoga sp.]MDK2884555.1 GTPase [Pseudothermotoga sp.]GLI49810.1 methylmalonyl Co-A mutase-associated GTPase MeaB [Pseudothermotoga lettingae TMO]
MNHKLLARLISKIENNPDQTPEILKDFQPGYSKIIGFTGSPGVGKSTLLNQIIKEVRKENFTAAVVAVDPSSPFSKGAFLGDRIRMRDHFLDDGVFIRSLASRGALGGLSDSTFDVVNLLEAAGFDYIFIETVGIGQAEVEISNLADIVVLVLSPGLGDDVQMMKAGVMEIADLYVINKADLSESDTLCSQLLSFLSLSNEQKDESRVIKTSASNGEGISELFSRMNKLWEIYKKEEVLNSRRRSRTRHHAENILRRMIQQAVEGVDGENPYAIVEKAFEKICVSKKYGQGGGI